MSVQAFVFDLDGTLVDSKIDFVAMRAELNIPAPHDILAHVESLAPDKRAAALEIVFRHERTGVVASTAIEGAREFVIKARSLGRPCAIFTRNARVLAQESLEMHGFEMDFVVAREDAPPKPKPDGLFKIARQFGVDVTRLFFIGDYIYDLQAGLSAGTPTALFLPTAPDFKTDGAGLIFQSFRQLSAQMF